MNKKLSCFAVLAVAFLITGNLIGAGILGLPVQAGLDGFIPTMVGMVIICTAMYFTAVVLGAEAIKQHKPSFNYPSPCRPWHVSEACRFRNARLVALPGG